MNEDPFSVIENTMDVHTTHYGTQYVWPIDLVLSKEEMLTLLAEVRAEAHTKKDR